MLLNAWGNGDQAALDRLTPLVYAELHRMARRHMRAERENTLQTTALVNEAYLRLVDLQGVGWRDRAHFFAVAARMMRRILVDFARARLFKKRDGGERVVLEEELVPADCIPRHYHTQDWAAATVRSLAIMAVSAGKADSQAELCQGKNGVVLAEGQDTGFSRGQRHDWQGM